MTKPTNLDNGWGTIAESAALRVGAAELMLRLQQVDNRSWETPDRTLVRLVGSERAPYCTTCGDRYCVHAAAVRLLLGLDQLDAAGHAATPITIGLPKKFSSWRPVQAAAIERLLATRQPHVLLEAPPGTGKSLIGAALQRLSGEQLLYTCTTKHLQDQMLDDFPHAQILKGRANYPTRNHPEITCDECEKTSDNPHCSHCVCTKEADGTWRHDCPYIEAKQQLVSADLGIVNTALLLAEANFVGELSGWPWVVADECDLLEPQLMSFVTVGVGKRLIKRLHLRPPEFKTKTEAWKDWCKDTLYQLEKSERDLGSWSTRDLKAVRLLTGKLRYWLSVIDDTHWVHCTTDWNRGPWIWKPVIVAPFAEEMLWKHGQRWLSMSASVFSVDQFCRDLGLDRGTVEFIRIPSAFPAENRPVFYWPIAKMNYREREQQLPSIGKALQQLVRAHPREKIMVHAPSYWLSQSAHTYLKKLGVPLFRFQNASERSIVVQQFREHRGGAVLIATAMERGIDLPDDLCTVNVILKVPFLSLGDPQVRARLYSYKDGQTWYRLQAVRNLVQASGRGVRHQHDRCATYILDAQFGELMRTSRALFPSWWLAAVHTADGPHGRWSSE